MRINATLPFDRSDAPGEFLHMAALTKVAQTLEQAGFSGANVTDHPCPPARWLDSGGHDAQDPFVTLSLVAAVTTRLRLQTGILVLPYRNPFITARAAASLDVFSGGRLSLGLGAGYLKGEFFVLGADFDSRNDVMDEYLKAMKAAWTGENFSFAGATYNARDCRMQPQPIQRPHPPLLVGGNSRRAIRRAAELGDGWYPFFTPAELSTTARTASMAGSEELIAGIDYMKEHCEKIGRTEMPEVFLGSIRRPGEEWNAQAILDKLMAYRELGVAGAVTHIEGESCEQWCDNARWFGTEVLAKLDTN
ncbi:LLM class F420-dependent oxidoreductase [Zhongshania aquimaris]|uniref:LLM class F420-dependent oxidoreductase n=1 Tax=Zhongshania aquimaris TaxID=2857107 RepID=A0ABS6VWM4_9GAMM|nr:LLM class F420-dependent oxidoreductase [Zhongshania aquimaris]MBW2942765.1 LLM class F420-dependent oxidoreductase [Zhongshania aquimaris]